MININKHSLKNLWLITKPGIIFGNLITVTGGFFLGIKHNIASGAINYNDINGLKYGNICLLFIMTVLGISLIIASGCVFNNFIDRDIDKLMDRTKTRVLVLGLVSEKIAIIYAIALGILGVILLYVFTNNLTVILSLIGLFVYVVVYSLWLKRSSSSATIIGSISGAMPPVVGYCAAMHVFDAGAVILFLMLCFWQIPHSYAIAIYRFIDYKNASIPVFPIKKGIEITKKHMLLYVVVFVILSTMLSFFGYTGKIYLIIAIIVGLFWIYLSYSGFSAKNNNLWARKMFICSILIITILAFVMAVNAI